MIFVYTHVLLCVRTRIEHYPCIPQKDPGTSATPPALSGLESLRPPPQQVHVYMYMKLLVLSLGL